MRKAFIAAPLIGTTIFLVAIFFAVNLSKTESSAVSEIASNAYHSRLISLMELYRSDLKSVFKIGISNSVENIISKQCWNYPLTLQYAVKSDGTVSDDSITSNGLGFYKSLYKFQTEVEKRLDYCYRLKKVVGGLVQASGNGTSIKQWLGALNNSIVFEGISFNIASQSKFSEFKTKLNSYSGWESSGKPTECVVTSSLGEPSPNCDAVISGACTEALTRKACSTGTEIEQLIGAGLFDCFSFAKMAEHPQEVPQYSCCSPQGAKAQEDAYTAVQAGGQVPDSNAMTALECNTNNNNYVAGCEGGQFYYQLNVKSPDVYPLLPRIEANDGKGNIIRSGGIADENEYLLIRYPFFKYYDLSLKFARQMALAKAGLQSTGFFDYNPPIQHSFGSTILDNGFLYGLCVTNSSAPNHACPLNYHDVRFSNPPQSSIVSNSLLRLAKYAASSLSGNAPQISFYFNSNGYTSDTTTDVSILDSADNSNLLNLINAYIITYLPSSDNTASGFYSPSFRPYLKLKDSDAGVQINPGVPNQFCVALDFSLG